MVKAVVVGLGVVGGAGARGRVGLRGDGVRVRWKVGSFWVRISS